MRLIFRRQTLLLVLFSITTGSLDAGEAIEGRWAADPHYCGGGTSLLIVYAAALRWGDAACAVKRSYRVKDTWHIGASCPVDGAISDVPVRIELRGERLLLEWASAPPQELQRCP